MKGILVQTTLNGEEDLIKIVESNIIGIDSEPIISQPPLFRDRHLTFCSYVCQGYEETYGNREGVIFETDAPVVYACPIDTHGLMRGGNWLPGYERFLFFSIEEMLRRYPTSKDFKIDFQRFFRNLKPSEVYPNNSKDFARRCYEADECLDKPIIWNPGCNEITFEKPLRVRNVRRFKSKDDLKVFYRA
ncbi:hypothetical protein FJZ17_01805 [Candidatus Pacearchaeota archaeon]|nr:hypothetical protein [Candidatus Pacearchaeota archaeon]